MRYEIIINTDNGDFYLDTFDSEPVDLNYSIAEIQDITKRNSSYSKTIVLPETPNNREVFNNISDLSFNSQFNPNKKSRCRILLDTLQIFDGFLQLKNITIDTVNGNKFNVVIFAENDNFFTEIGDSFLTDLDFSDYNHVYGTTSIIDSWNDNYESGFYYPLIDYGYNWIYDDISGTGATANTVNINEMFPATYVRTIWDKIFSNSGYTYQSSFINDDPNSVFNQLIIPFNNNKLLAVGQEDPNFIFYAGASGTQSVLCQVQQLDQYTQPAQKGGVAQTRYYARSISNTILDFPIETFPFSDPSGQWSINEFTQIFTPNYIQRFRITLNITAISGIFSSSETIPAYPFGPQITNPGRIRILAYREFNPDGTLNANWATGTGYLFAVSQNFGTSTSISYETPYLDNSTPALTYLYLNENVRFVLEVSAYNFDTNTVPPYPYAIGATMTTVLSGSITNEIDSTLLLPGQTLNYLSAIPANIKQKDFIISIAKMFNLYIDKNVDFENSLIVEPRDVYYTLGNGEIKDWTSKIDISKDIDSSIIADLTNKQILLTYKEDKDYWNTFYKSVFNEIYGQYLYDTGNDFTKGEKKIEVIFSPTPLVLVKDSSSIMIPKISKDTQNYNGGVPPRDNYNIRILRRYSGLLDILTDDEFFSFNGVQYTQYPYAGHYDDPYAVTEDINFGILKDSYIPISNYPNRNLYTMYYENFFNEIYSKDSRIISVDMYLTSQDIQDFRFWDIINLYFNGSNQYYRVNKISGFNPLFDSTCRVEFIKILDTKVPSESFADLTNTGFVPGGGNVNFTNIVTSARNSIQANRNIITGRGNAVLNDNNLIVGYSNNLNFKNSFNIGDSNTIEYSESIFNNGFENILETVFKSNINGDSNLASQSSNLNIFGDLNLVKESSSIDIFGFSNSVLNSNVVYVKGAENDFNNLLNVNITGDFNIVEDSSNSFIIGNNNQLLGTSSNIILIGDNTVLNNKSDYFYIGKDTIFNNDTTFENNVDFNSNVNFNFDINLSNNEILSRTSSTIGTQSIKAQVVTNIDKSLYIKVIFQACDKNDDYIYTSELTSAIDNSFNIVGTVSKIEFTNFTQSLPITDIQSEPGAVFAVATGVTYSDLNWKLNIQTYNF